MSINSTIEAESPFPEQMMLQIIVETIRSHNIQLLQTQGTILTMRMNVLKLSMERNHWINGH